MATTARKRYAAPKARNDAYTGLLFISLLALLTSCVLLYLDYAQYGAQKPPSMPNIPKAGAGVSLPVGGDSAPAPGPMDGAPGGGPMGPGGPPAGPMNPTPMGPMGGAPMGPGNATIPPPPGGR